MKQDKDRIKLTPIKLGKISDLDFPKSPKLKSSKKRKKFWSPFHTTGEKAKRVGARYYRRQMRRVKRDVRL